MFQRAWLGDNFTLMIKTLIGCNQGNKGAAIGDATSVGIPAPVGVSAAVAPEDTSTDGKPAVAMAEYPPPPPQN